jgi:hypothetical protein
MQEREERGGGERRGREPSHTQVSHMGFSISSFIYFYLLAFSF